MKYLLKAEPNARCKLICTKDKIYNGLSEKYFLYLLGNVFRLLENTFLLKAPASRDPKAAFCQPGHDFRVADDDCDERNLKKGFCQKMKGM